jgi:hypothetical protein
MNDGDKVRAPFGCKGRDRGVSVGKRAIAVSIASGPDSTRPDYCTTLVRRSLSRLTRRLKNIRLGPGNKPTTQT